MSDYIWSDLHLNHSNIIEYEGRPYASVEEMNAALLGAWGSTIKKNDVLWNLGDVALHMSREMLTKMLSGLPGKKILILGNHDRGRSIPWWYSVGFDVVYEYPIILNNFYMLSHKPLYVNRSMPYVNIHGHTHGTSSDNPQQVNVSVEVIGYKPVLLQSIQDRFKSIEED